ncbi:hypothetical protein HDU89_007820 [Geranomyces variabilis]|nr:hypothetical protein HDU89_007820 [Geranomyces variabilis]
MNADILPIVSNTYLSYNDKLRMRQVCKLFFQCVTWSDNERISMLCIALKGYNAPEEYILRLLSTPIKTVNERYMYLLFGACRRRMWEVVKFFLLKDPRFSDTERGSAFALACCEPEKKLLEELLADKGFTFAFEDSRAYQEGPKEWMFQGSLDTLKLVLADGRTRPFFSWKPAIHHAVLREMNDVAIYLLQMMRSEPSATYNLVRLLQTATVRPNMTILKMLILDYGVDPASASNEAIRVACRNGDVEFVRHLLSDSRVDPMDSDPNELKSNALFAASTADQAKVVELLLQDPRIDPAANNNWAIYAASGHGACSAVKILMLDPRVKLSNESLYVACDAGRRDVVDLLLQDERIDPTADHNKALRLAIGGDTRANDDDDVVLRLLQDPRIDPSFNNNEAVQNVARYRSARVMAELLKDPRVNPAANDNYAIRVARRDQREDVVTVLLADERVDPEADALSDWSDDDDDSESGSGHSSH